jgi:predicted nucleotidyltransferase|tara:strand:+ start:385 stop:1182 length:798 start_codon:yes stop_codon:yes gene_type:complete
MKTLTKKTIKVGNSSGVLLPAEWLNGIVEVKLVEAPLNYDKLINKILLILKDKLLDVESLAITGSYARGEQIKNSDIDILAITKKIDEHLRIENFDILFLTEKKIKEDFEKNPLPLLPMLKEAKPIINNNLIEKYAKYPLNKKSLKWHIDTTKSAINLAKKDLKISKEINMNAEDAVSYSLVLRLRTLYIINCLRKNKIWKSVEFLNLIKNITGSVEAYNGYLRVKNKKDKKYKSKLKIIEAERLICYIDEKLAGIEKWVKGKKD